MSDLTEILNSVRAGDPNASDELFVAVYAELRQVAARRLANEAPGQTLQATALVHEVWVRLGGSESGTWDDRRHFFGAASEAMRRTLVDNARRKQRIKRGGADGKRVELGDLSVEGLPLEDELLDLDEALKVFEQQDPEKAKIVKLKFFGGWTIDEISKMTSLSTATVERYWAYSRAWLHRQMKG